MKRRKIKPPKLGTPNIKEPSWMTDNRIATVKETRTAAGRNSKKQKEGAKSKSSTSS